MKLTPEQRAIHADTILKHALADVPLLNKEAMRPSWEHERRALLRETGSDIFDEGWRLSAVEELLAA